MIKRLRKNKGSTRYVKSRAIMDILIAGFLGVTECNDQDVKPRMLPLLTTKISLSFYILYFPFFYILRNKYSQISSCYLYCLGNSVCYGLVDTINI